MLVVLETFFEPKPKAEKAETTDDADTWHPTLGPMDGAGWRMENANHDWSCLIPQPPDFISLAT